MRSYLRSYTQPGLASARKREAPRLWRRSQHKRFVTSLPRKTSFLALRGSGVRRFLAHELDAEWVLPNGHGRQKYRFWISTRDREDAYIVGDRP